MLTTVSGPIFLASVGFNSFGLSPQPKQALPNHCRRLRLSGWKTVIYLLRSGAAGMAAGGDGPGSLAGTCLPVPCSSSSSSSWSNVLGFVSPLALRSPPRGRGK